MVTGPRTYPPNPRVNPRKFPLPPGPPELPIVGQTFRYVREPIELMREAAKYGDIATMSVKPWLIYLLSHPDLVEQVLVTNHLRVGRWRNVEAFKYVMGEGLVTSDEPLHLRQRRMMQPQFHHRLIEGYGRTMIDYAISHAQGWRDRALVDMSREMRDLTLKIVVKTLFSIDIPSEVRRLGKAFELSNWYISARFNQFERMREILHNLPLPFTRSFKRQLAYVDRVVYDLIEERRQTGSDNGDLLDMMLAAEDDEAVEQDATRMTDLQARDETVTMFAVGHETVTIALTWAWHLLALHPEVQEQFHAELDEVLDGHPPTVADLADLVVTEQILTEAMRLYPPIWRTGRVVLEPIELAGYPIPPGAMLCISPLITHRDPRWFENPEKFQPHRWTPEFRGQLHKFAYYPFGGGPRLCIGEGFAWMEMKLIMAVVGQHWSVSPATSHTIEFTPLISLRPKDGMALRLERR